MSAIPMSNTKRGKIAEKFVKYILREKGLGSLNPDDLRSKLVDISEDIDVELEELIAFVQPIYQELLIEAFRDSRN